MVTQYPYKLEEYQVADSVLGTTGEFSDVVGEWVEISSCRDESFVMGGGNRMITAADGQAITTSSLIQLPLTCPTLHEGALVRVMNGDVVRLEGKVLRFSRDQLHCRTWV